MNVKNRVINRNGVVYGEYHEQTLQRLNTLQPGTVFRFPRGLPGRFYKVLNPPQRVSLRELSNCACAMCQAHNARVRRDIARQDTGVAPVRYWSFFNENKYTSRGDPMVYVLT
jgi:hypothetical protein